MKDDDFLHWFAGFVAGEGCFTIKHHEYYNSFQCNLHICLRDDDLPVLLEIQERLKMGKIYRTAKRGKTRPGAKPSAAWRVNRIDDLLRLMNVFDSHPLRARKQDDYEIWREAVMEINKGRQRGYEPATYNRKYLAYLARKLHFIRGYEQPEIDDFEPGAEQLELPLEEEGGD